MRDQTTDDWTVGRHLTALLAAAPESIDRLSWSREQIEAHQEVAMRRLLAHAVEHSAFHAERLRGVDINGWRLADLAALPVMTKRDMMGAFDRVLTDPSVTKARAEDHLAAHGQSLAYLDGRYLVITSGGSSGERGVFVWGVDAFTEYALTSVRRTMAKLASLGVTRDDPVSGALVAAGSPLHATAIVGQLMGGPGAAVSMSAIPATLPFDEIVHTAGLGVARRVPPDPGRSGGRDRDHASRCGNCAGVVVGGVDLVRQTPGSPLPQLAEIAGA